MLTRERNINNKWKLIMMVTCGSLRLFWQRRPILSGAAGWRDVEEIQVVLKCEAKWVLRKDVK